ncbi:MAG: HAMP domain-containing histidine kinase, partial [Bacteroidales bacterium]|nr:HAMP domain-containing histidine kinase [Bacteroidales bacterium]
HPVLWGLTYMGLFFLISTIVTMVVAGYMKYRMKDKQAMLDKLEESQDLSNLALRGANTIIVNSVEDIARGEHFMHPDYLDSFKEALERYKRGDDNFTNLVLLNDPSRGDGYKWWELRVGKAIEIDGERVVPALIIDVDDSVRRKQQLIEARKIAEEARAKETFIMNISHEMRTPLNAIVGFSQALSQLNDLLSDEEVRQYGRYIKDNAEVLSVMVNDILQFSRLESGRVKMVPEEINVKELLDTLIFEWQDKLTGKVGLELADCPPDLYISADSLRLKEVINQYIGNGLKFSNKGTVTVGCTFDKNTERAKIWVKDEGPGIPAEKLQFTFKLFWKGDAFIPGVGLGLSIAKSFTEMMGGVVGVESQVGFGSTFSSEFDGYIK